MKKYINIKVTKVNEFSCWSKTNWWNCYEEYNLIFPNRDIR